jgi:hypothetical protein
MLPTNERLMIGLKVLERLRSGWQDGHAQIYSWLQSNSRSQTGSSPLEDTGDPGSLWPPPLETLLAQSGDMSPYSLVLGVCEDGLPFLLDLTNPAPGSLLIAGDRGGGKARLLRSMLTSASLLNSPQQVNFHLLAREPQRYDALAQLDHCQGVIRIHESGPGQLINKFADIAENRRRTRPEDPFIILAIDDLYTAMRSLNKDDFARLYWLMRHGPRSFIWPIVTLSAEDSMKVNPRILTALRTRLIGHIHYDDQAAFLSQDERLDARWIEEGMQFYVPYGDDWLPLWVCDPQVNEQIPEDPSTNMTEADSTPKSSPPIPTDATIEELLSWNERLGSGVDDTPPVFDRQAEMRYQTKDSTEQVNTLRSRPDGSVPPMSRSFEQTDNLQSTGKSPSELNPIPSSGLPDDDLGSIKPSDHSSMNLNSPGEDRLERPERGTSVPDSQIESHLDSRTDLTNTGPTAKNDPPEPAESEPEGITERPLNEVVEPTDQTVPDDETSEAHLFYEDISEANSSDENTSEDENSESSDEESQIEYEYIDEDDGFSEDNESNGGFQRPTSFGSDSHSEINEP